MAYVHEIKFFLKGKQLQVALFDKPPPLCSEFWIKNVASDTLGFTELPEGVELEKKYQVETLGLKPFPASKPLFDFVDVVAKEAWEKGGPILIRKILFENPARC